MNTVPFLFRLLPLTVKWRSIKAINVYLEMRIKGNARVTLDDKGIHLQEHRENEKEKEKENEEIGIRLL